MIRDKSTSRMPLGVLLLCYGLRNGDETAEPKALTPKQTFDLGRDGACF